MSEVNKPKEAPARLPNGQYAPGVSGNPSGRPEGSVSLLTALKRILREHPERVDKIADNLLAMAESGDQQALSAIRTLLDRLDGPVATRIEGPDGGPVEIDLKFR